MAGAADAEYRDCSCRGPLQHAEWLACKHDPVRMPRALMPNPSLKRSANGRPPGPVWRYAVHFHQPGPGVLPLALRLSEGLGIGARGMRTGSCLHASHSACRCAPRQEQSRYSASAAHAKNYAWRSASCSADYSLASVALIPCRCSGRPTSIDLCSTHPSADIPAASSLLNPFRRLWRRPDRKSVV